MHVTIDTAVIALAGTIASLGTGVITWLLRDRSRILDALERERQGREADRAQHALELLAESQKREELRSRSNKTILQAVGRLGQLASLIATDRRKTHSR